MAPVELRARLPDGPGCRECPGQVGWGGPPVGVPSGPGRPRPAFRSKDQAFAPPRQADEGVGRGPEGRPYGRGGPPWGGLTKWHWAPRGLSSWRRTGEPYFTGKVTEPTAFVF
jgi:hypothetical protein